MRGAPGCGIGCGCLGLGAAIALVLAIGLAGLLGGVWATAAAGSTSGGATGVVVWPVGGRVSQRFGPTAFTGEPALCYEGTCYAHFHDGLDIAAPAGTPVLAMAAGRVTLAGRVADGAVVVVIDHGRGVTTLYGHLEPALAVSEGDQVAAGQVLGAVGLTGHTTGPHLHLEVWSGGVPVDPLTVLPPRP